MDYNLYYMINVSIYNGENKIMEPNPLESLLVDAAEIDKTTLAEALQGVISIDSKTGRLVLTPEFEKLDARKKVLMYFLGQKAAYLLQKVDSEYLQPKDIVNSTGIPRGTVAPKVKDLKDSRLISHDESMGYFVSSHQFRAAIKALEEN